MAHCLLYVRSTAHEYWALSPSFPTPSIAYSAVLTRFKCVAFSLAGCSGWPAEEDASLRAISENTPQTSPRAWVLQRRVLSSGREEGVQCKATEWRGHRPWGLIWFLSMKFTCLVAILSELRGGVLCMYITPQAIDGVWHFLEIARGFHIYMRWCSFD